MDNFLITGASRGIGRALALSLSSHGRVFAIARSQEGLQSLESESGGRILPLAFHIGKDPWGTLVDFIEPFGRLRSVIHSAAAMVNKPFLELTDEDVHAIFVQNAIAPFGLFRSLIPLAEPGAHFISIGTMGGITGSEKFPGLSAYSSSKAALMTLTECLQCEFASTDLSFNVLALGAVSTEMLAEAFPGYRAPIEAGEMAEFIRDFALNGHRYIRGKVIPVSRSTP